jgi:hypothetical protein
MIVWRNSMNDPSNKLTKFELLDQIRVERGRLEDLLTQLTHPEMLMPGVDGEWSVKDALAHISTWERWMIRWTGNLLRGEMPDTPVTWDVERMNAETFARVREIPLEEVLEEFQKSYLDALNLVENLDEEQLQIHYSDKWPMGALWTGIADNMNSHYRDHRNDILKWIEKRKG